MGDVEEQVSTSGSDPPWLYFFIAIPCLFFGAFMAKGLRHAIAEHHLRGIILAGSVTTLFFVIAGSMLLLGANGLYEKRYRRRQREMNAQEPWRGTREWATGRITYGSAAVAVWGWVGAIAVTAFAIPLTDAALHQWAEHRNFFSVLGVLPPLAALACFAWAVRSTARWMKYGNAVFEMAEVPGVIGGRLGGVVHAKLPRQPDDGVTVRLKCVRYWQKRAYEESTRNEEILWQSEFVSKEDLLQPRSGRAVIPVAFDIPADCVDSDNADPYEGIEWRLTVEAAASGVDYFAKFVVPVFRTGNK